MTTSDRDRQSAAGSRQAKGDNAVESIELDLLLEAVFRRYGYDFREYARATLKRRIAGRVQEEGLSTISALQERVLHDPACMDRLLLGLTIHTTAMFRDPSFYRALRQAVIPLLRTYPFVRIWLAGCSTGEEAYSMAILLVEEGLFEHSRIYATDLSEAALSRAKAGVFPLGSRREYTDNYIRAGGTASFSDYYLAGRDRAVLRPALRERIVFAEHNLATDASFNEFQLILCRNVMIYFSRRLQDRVHHLLYQSLSALGVLALGDKESLRLTSHEADYEVLDGREKLYRKIR